MASIVGIGSIMFDIFSYIPEIPKPGESLPCPNFVSGFGGKGANPCVAASRLGAATTLIGKVGKDVYGKSQIENLQQNNISTDYIFQTDETSSGIAVIIVEDSGQNRIIVGTGANLLLTKDEVKKAENVIQKAKVLISNFETNLEACLEALKLAKKYGVKTILNAAPAVANPPSEFYSIADVFIVNETEAEIISGLSIGSVEDARQVTAEFLKRGCNTIIITLGSKGAMFAKKEDQVIAHVQSEPVKAVDTTGAGDAFVGALAYYMAHHPNLSLKEQVLRSCRIAGCSVQKPGTQISYPQRKELPDSWFSDVEN